jgi:hypothetical protein
MLGTVLAVYLVFSNVVALITNFMAWDFIAYASFAFIVICAVGVIVAWFKEKIGGIILVVSAVAVSIFSIIVGLNNPNFDFMDLIILVGLPFLIIGILFLVYWWKSRKLSASQ